MEICEKMKVFLTTGEVFVIDNDMRTKQSCTEWDVYRFQKEKLIIKIAKEETK